jgi:predicted AAA+ superfamily ATPase
LFQEIIASQTWYSDTLTQTQLCEFFSEQIDTLLLLCLTFGHYPEVVTTKNKAAYLRNLTSDYLWKDILELDLVRTPEIIRRLLMLLAHQVGAEVSINEIASTLGISRQTVNRYIDLLEETFVIFRLSAFSTNPRKEINKNQKIYFWDTGIRNALLNNLSINPIRPDIGALWENWVIAEFAKKNLLNDRTQKLYFWRTRHGSEVDLVVQSDNRLEAYEVKWRKRRTANRAFTSHYGVDVQIIDRTRPLF